MSTSINYNDIFLFVLVVTILHHANMCIRIFFTNQRPSFRLYLHDTIEYSEHFRVGWTQHFCSELGRRLDIL